MCRIGGAAKIALVLVSLFGFFTFDLVYIFSIMNYVIQGELNIYLLWDIRKLTEMKSYDHVDGTIKVSKELKQVMLPVRKDEGVSS